MALRSLRKHIPPKAMLLVKTFLPKKRFPAAWLVKLCLGCLLAGYPAGLWAQGTISGKVQTTQAEPLEGAQVMVKGTTRGVITGSDGTFSLRASPGDTLLVSFIGFRPQVVPVGAQSSYDIRMEAREVALDEVVMVGYGTQRKSDLTGAVSSVNAEDMQKLAVASIDQALQGRASGVYINRNSGGPGEGAKIFIRGPSSINAADPLWIVDGVQATPGVDFNMNDVESIEVLKDASAAAIYGAQAANGVIIVTTKRGKSGRPQLGFHAYTGINTPQNIPTPLNTAQYAEIKNRARDAEGLDRIPLFADPDNLPETSTNWADEVFRTAPIHMADLSVSGGNEKSNFFISGNYMHEGGTMVESSYERFTFRANSDFQVTDWLRLGESFIGSISARDPVQVSYDAWIRAIPSMPVRDPANPFGGFGASVLEDDFQGTNPVGNELRRDDLNRNYGVNGNVYAEIKFFEGLTLRGNYGLNLDLGRQTEFQDAFFFGPGSTQNRPFSSLREQSATTVNHVANAVLNFNRTFGDHRIGALAGYELFDWERESFFAYGERLANGLRILDAADPTTVTAGSNRVQVRRLSQFARLSYNYKDRYLFTSNIRRDGSSRFGPQNRFGVFPSISAGWRLDQETFMAGQQLVSLLKLRAGWGVLGNDNIGDYLYRPVYDVGQHFYTFGTGGDETLVNGVRIDRFVNEAIKWEEVTQVNIGLDANFWQDKLQVTADFYLKNTTDMLMDGPMAQSAGYNGYNTGSLLAPPKINLGRVRNQGVELAVTYYETIGDLKMTLRGNVSYNENEVLELAQDQPLVSGSWAGTGGLPPARTEAGFPMGYFFGFVADGIFRNQAEVDAANALTEDPAVFYQHPNTAPGDLRFQDLNGDGVITDEDRTFIGNPWPKYFFGLNMNFEWRNFDLSLFFQGLAGREVLNAFRVNYEQIVGDRNLTTRALDGWTPENATSDIPRITWSDFNQTASRPSSYWVENGDFVRLRNAQLGYNVPQPVLEKIGLRRLRLYVSGMNLLLFTHYSGMDPEFNRTGNNFSDQGNLSQGIDLGIYPVSRTWLGGLQFDF